MLLQPHNMNVECRCLLASVLLGGVLSAQPAREIVMAPPELAQAGWLDDLRTAQLRSAGGADVYTGFQFVDRIADSQIAFQHRIVSDSGRTYKAVHYDHGNGLAVADVDDDGLPDLYFTTQVGTNGLWRNLGGGRFEDWTERAGVGAANRIGVSASFADIDNDGDPDLYVTTVRGGNLLFENVGDGRFRDISAASGLGYVGHSSSAVFFDYDRDGLLDLFLVNVGKYTTDEVGGDGYRYYVGVAHDAFFSHRVPELAEQSILFRNRGGNRFVDISADVGLQDRRWSGDASPIDVNDDGWIDLYVLNMQGDDEYYENVGGKRFVARGREVFPRTSWGAMGIKVFDFNNDGRLDILVTDMHSDMSERVGPAREKRKATMRWDASMVGDGKTSIWGNSFFLKEGPGRFREVSDEIGAETYWPWGPSVGDLNADGYDDVFIAAGMNFPFRYGPNSLLLNDRGRRFLDAEFIVGLEPRQGGLVVPWFDVVRADKVGWLTLTRETSIKGPPRDVTVMAARGSRSAAIVDLDGDGDLDIVTNEFNARPMVLVSNLAEKWKVRYLNVKLIGTTSNRSGLGAVVKVTAGGQTYTKANDGKSGYLSQSLYPLYFGLGDAATVDRVEVLWPSGQTQIERGPISANSLIKVTEK
jgi:enediyne biosynthesis protein E4